MHPYYDYVENEMDYDFDEYDYDGDPEIEDAANNHRQEPSFTKERTMNNVKVISRPTRGISAHYLKIGEYASVTEPSGDAQVGDIVLKTRTVVVNITNPNVVWDSPFSSPIVERLQTGDKVEVTTGLTTDFETRILNEARSNKINAIKSVREATSWGLKESKDYVDSLLLKF